MAKKIIYICSKCGYESSGYFGKCPSCDSWNTLEEKSENKIQGVINRDNKKSSVKLSDISLSNSERIKTEYQEFNRVMGGGIVKDSVTILTAKPGAGKSTLILQIAHDLAQKDHKILYASGEESESQIKNRAERILGSNLKNIWVISTNSFNDVEEEINSIDPDFIIVDSIQTMRVEELSQRAGSPTQTMECANRLVNTAKNAANPKCVFMIGQMTKEDELAGVRALEHLVDTVLIIDSDQDSQLRTLNTTKNRYGGTGEMGFFEMTEDGLISIDNPSEYFVTRRGENNQATGSTLTMLREGSRNIVVEVESLVSKTFMPYPQRISESMNRDKFNTIVSILEERGGVKLYDKNIVLKTTGGIRLSEPSSTLAVIMSIASSALNRPISSDIVFIGDVGLTGEIKKTRNLAHRINELERLGYKEVYIAKDSEKLNAQGKLKINYVLKLSELLTRFFN
ncbi:MAG: DNA repair protein RadA [Tissierellia bacterium]|nr:DNA repair protein RadA [Tissierellia bacterium]